MDLINQIGISYKAGYLVQGNQLDKCKTSTKLQLYNTEFQLRSDGKDFDMASIIKDYRGNVIFHVPSVNIDLGNLKSIDSKVKKLVNNDIKMITINASNLTLDLFEWSTIEEQKKYFLNVAIAIATLASNRIIVAIENMANKGENGYFGNNITQISDIIIYSKKLLMKDFGFSEDEANKYIGLSLNIDNVIKNETISGIEKWFKVFSNDIECIKFSTKIDSYNEVLDMILTECLNKKYDVPILLQTEKELEEIGKDYKMLDQKVRELLKKNGLEIKPNKIKPIAEAGYTNIIITSITVITVVAAVLMLLVKIRS